MQEKSDKVIGMLEKRNFERKLDKERELEQKKLADAENEKVEYFESVFNENKGKILNGIVDARKIEREALPGHFDDISREILTLQKYVAASSMFLRGYDIKIYLQNLQKITAEMKELEEELMPKKKFGFRAKKQKPKPKFVGVVNGKTADAAKVDEVDSANVGRNRARAPCGFSKESGKELALERCAMLRNDVALTNLGNCKVRLLGSPSTLHMNNLTGCYVFCGPVSTSVFVDNCENCTFVVACQQLRLHSSKCVDIYLHVTSRAIMEDCNRIGLAPYNLQYPGLESDFHESGLSTETNNWTCVDDFNWLNNKKSPNWDVLEENKRIKSWGSFLY